MAFSDIERRKDKNFSLEKNYAGACANIEEKPYGATLNNSLIFKSLEISKHLILQVWKQTSDIRKLEETFNGNSVKISDCQAFSLFESVPGCRAFSHSVNCNLFKELHFPRI